VARASGSGRSASTAGDRRGPLLPGAFCITAASRDGRRAVASALASPPHVARGHPSAGWPGDTRRE
jgi:hypothetical protein